MAKIVVDPITRIEGHLRIEAQVDGGRVADAWSSSTMFRGIEIILKGRDPRDAWLFTQRICGVCTMVHAGASVRAVENALGIAVPPNAQLIRQLILGAQTIQDHVIHFYHLSALDWVDAVNALQADPAKTAATAQSISEWPQSSATYFRGVQQKLKALADSGQLSILTNGYWGHPAYRLPPEVNLIAVAHYLEALDWQRRFIQVHAILGAKNPHPQTYLVGGVARPVDLSSQAALNDHDLAKMRELFREAAELVNQLYLPDLKAIASFYPEWTGYGAGVGNYLAYGDYPETVTGRYAEEAPSFFLPGGVIFQRQLDKLQPVDPGKITEYVTHSWYRYPDEGHGRQPIDGITDPHYTGPEPPYDFLKTDGKYSWIKAPRYEERPMEVGPLARMLVAYAAGHQKVRALTGQVLQDLKLDTTALFSTLGRHAARCLETVLLAGKMEDLLDRLSTSIGHGDLRIHNNEYWDPASWPKEASGHGTLEAPRGALGHWIRIKDRKILNYQAVVPSTWNGGPRDAAGQRGPYEAALVGTPVADPERPLEILRTIHSFDPCMACAVHLLDLRGRWRHAVRVV
ncbi:MAG: nickel-dependent hydrogenase large subunit [Desulfobacteraceae bacterium]|nr:nickel-dependent hydrogenase large subunit [Desulfobacteraceae bacterium]